MVCPKPGTGRGLDILWQHNMQINYACHPNVVLNLPVYYWVWAEQNPAYRLAVTATPRKGLFLWLVSSGLWLVGSGLWVVNRHPDENRGPVRLCRGLVSGGDNETPAYAGVTKRVPV